MMCIDLCSPELAMQQVSSRTFELPGALQGWALPQVHALLEEQGIKGPGLMCYNLCHSIIVTACRSSWYRPMQRSSLPLNS